MYLLASAALLRIGKYRSFSSCCSYRCYLLFRLRHLIFPQLSAETGRSQKSWINKNKLAGELCDKKKKKKREREIWQYILITTCRWKSGKKKFKWLFSETPKSYCNNWPSPEIKKQRGWKNKSVQPMNNCMCLKKKKKKKRKETEWG